MQYFQMEITIGIEAESQEAADALALKLLDAVAVPLYANDTEEAKVFESFTTQPFPYP